MTPLTRLITFLILCICVLTPIEAKTLRVGYIPSAPYVDLQNKEKPGIAIEIWDTVAKKNKWDYKLINEKDNVDTAIDNLKAKKIDILIGGIGVNPERIQKVDFSRPFFISHIGLMTSTEWKPGFYESLLSLLKELASIHALEALIAFIVLVHLLWLVTRGDESPKSYTSGILATAWFTFFAVFASNYLFSKSKTKHHVIVAFIFSITSTCVFSIIIASFSSALSTSVAGKNIITNIEQLRTQTIAGLKGSSNIELAQKLQLHIIPIKSYKEGAAMTHQKKIVGVIGDHSALQSFIQTQKTNKLYMAPINLDYDEVAFAFSKENGSLRTEFNETLTKMQDSKTVLRYCKAYFSPKIARLCAL